MVEEQQKRAMNENRRLEDNAEIRKELFVSGKMHSDTSVRLYVALWGKRHVTDAELATRDGQMSVTSGCGVKSKQGTVCHKME